MKILIIEDDQKTASFIGKGLKQEGFSVEHAADGEEGLHFAVTGNYDLIVADIMLPKLDGFSVIDKLRQKDIRTPVLILSAKSDVSDRIQGLQTGGDDYLIKPFAFSELLARIQALIRRARSQPLQTLLAVEDLKMDTLRRKVIRQDCEIELQPREYSLLEFLMRHAGRVVSKTMIMENVWDYNFDPQTNVVEARICRLRDKIDKGFEKKLIRTVRGVGYVIG